jgi:hypothetical protein
VPLIPSQEVDNVSPNAGMSGPGGDQQVTITGSGFTGATAVSFGSVDVTSTSFPCLSSPAGCFDQADATDTQIVADTPVQTAQTVDVVINGSPTGSSDQYSYFDPPTVTNVDSPQDQGATGVAVTGTNFSYPGVTPATSGVSEVDLNPTGAGSTIPITNTCTGSQPNCFDFEDDSDLTINLPNSVPAGNYDVQVITPGGKSATGAADVLTVLAPTPTLTSLSPTSGSTLGGNNVNLTGTDFTGTTDVNWGTVEDINTVCGTGTCFSINSSTSITVDNVPANSAGPINVTVTTGSGTSNNKTYTYVTPVPTLTSLSPTSGSTLGGNDVILTGTDLTGATDVNFGSNDLKSCPAAPCFTFNSDAQITVDGVPTSAAGPVSVSVTTSGGTSNNKTYTYVTPVPTLTSLSPTSGSTLGGNDVILTGTDLTGATDVNFGSNDLKSCPAAPCFTFNSDTQITVDGVPANAAVPVSVSVTTSGGTSNNKTYTYVTPVPTLTSLSPTSGSTLGGNSVTLTGTNFTGATDVNFGSHDIQTCGTSPCFNVDSSTQITVDSAPPNGPGSVLVSVTTPGGTSGNVSYLYVTPPPTLTNLLPTSGPTDGGNSVVLTGTNFTGATGVDVGSNVLPPCPSASCFTFNSDTQITVTMPANTPGSVSVTVTTPGGTTSSLPYLYVAPAPTVTNVSPNEGALAGGNIVTLTGTGFEAAGTPIVSQVTVGTTAITAACAVPPTSQCFNVTSATSITIGFMPGGTGQPNITVTTPGGTSAASSANTYTYNASLPSVTEVSPRNGATSGGEAISVLGSGFGQAGQDFVTDVFFGTNDVQESNTYPCPTTSSGCFIVVGPTQLAVYTPANVAGTVHVTVKTPLGTSNPGTGDDYTFVAPGAYTAVIPYRVCDTRPAAPGIAHNECNTGVGTNKTLGTNGALTAQITTATSGQVPIGAQAVVVNVTAIDHSSTSTFVTAYPAGGSRPLASNINLSGGKVEANLVIVQLSSSGAITLFNAVGSTDVIVDVEGYFATPPGGSNAGQFHSIPPLRICDSRGGKDTECAGTTNDALVGGHWRDVVLSGIPPSAPVGTPSIPATADAAAAVFNLTAVGGTESTFLSVAPALTNHTCPTSAPAFSNVNPAAGTALPNRVISKLGPGQDVCIFSAVGSINIVVDVNGWFGSASASAGVSFYSVPPTRVCDTRSGSGTTCAVPPGSPGLTGAESDPILIAGQTAVPADNVHSTAPVAVVANLTGIAGTATTFFTLYPSDAAKPEASDLNPAVGQVIANLAIVELSTTGTSDGDVSLYNAAGDINAILDVAGWFQ